MSILDVATDAEMPAYRLRTKQPIDKERERAMAELCKAAFWSCPSDACAQQLADLSEAVAVGKDDAGLARMVRELVERGVAWAKENS